MVPRSFVADHVLPQIRDVRLAAGRDRTREQHGDADQAVQLGQARHDARGARQTGSASERASGDLVHGAARLMHFVHSLATIVPELVSAGKEETL